MGEKMSATSQSGGGVVHETLIGALAAALADVEGAVKDSQNPHLKNKYADLSSVIAAIKPVARHGVWFRQVTKPDDAGARVETFYIHQSGELSAGEMFVPASKRDPQGFGSALTYCRRYALQTAFGIAPEDDDGEAATASFKADRDAPRDKPTPAPAQKQTMITDAQAVKIQALCKSIGGNVLADLIAAFQAKDKAIKSINDLTVGRAEKAIERLEERLSKKAQAESDSRLGDGLGDEIPDFGGAA